MKRALNVLVVDDEANLRLTLAEILRDEGYSVEVADSGLQAIEKCRGGCFDVILMDVRMPDLNGVDAFRQIQRNCRSARVIMMSAYSVDELKDAALAEGAIAFLAKPLDIDAVIRLIGELRDTAILIVADDQRTVAQLCGLLAERGFRVTVVRTPHAALEIVAQTRFDIIFIDAQLPATDGLDLGLAVRKLTPSAVAIMLAGRQDESARLTEASGRAAYTVLSKPLDTQRVLQLLEELTGPRPRETTPRPVAGNP